MGHYFLDTQYESRIQNQDPFLKLFMEPYSVFYPAFDNSKNLNPAHFGSTYYTSCEGGFVLKLNIEQYSPSYFAGAPVLWLNINFYYDINDLNPLSFHKDPNPVIILYINHGNIWTV